MSDREKRNMFLLGGIALAILLLFVWRGKVAGAVGTVVQQAEGIDTTVPGIDVPNYVIDLPPLNYHSSGAGNFTYQGGNTSFGCAMCAGIGNYNILPISPPVEVKATQDETKTPAPVVMLPPNNQPRAMVFSSNAGASPASNYWWSNSGSTAAGALF